MWAKTAWDARIFSSSTIIPSHISNSNLDHNTQGPLLVSLLFIDYPCRGHIRHHPSIATWHSFVPRRTAGNKAGMRSGTYRSHKLGNSPAIVLSHSSRRLIYLVICIQTWVRFCDTNYAPPCLWRPPYYLQCLTRHCPRASNVIPEPRLRYTSNTCCGLRELYPVCSPACT